MATHFNGTQIQENIYHMPDPPPSATTHGPPVPIKRSNSARQHLYTGPSSGASTSSAPRPPNPASRTHHSPPLPSRRDHTYEPTPGTTSHRPKLQALPQEKPTMNSGGQVRRNPSQRVQRSPSLDSMPATSRGTSTNDAMSTYSPKLPDKPLRKNPAAANSMPKNRQQNQPAEDAEGISLRELVKRYSQSFPLRIRVLRGYCGQTSRLTISTQDVYNIHFMKHTKVVGMQDSHGNPYSIPLNSSVEFGIVYDPNERRDEALEGFKFESVADILPLAHPPKVLCATRQWFGDDARIVVKLNEVFIVKQVLKPKFKGKKGLRAFSMLTKTEKFLPDDCAAHFTTQPYSVRLHLPEMMEHLVSPFPCQACLFLDESIYQNPDMESQIQDLPDALLTKVITLRHSITETSLIASSVLRGKPHPYDYIDNRTTSEESILFDIPVDETLDEIEVAVLDASDSKATEQLYDSTRAIYERFNPRKVRTYSKDTGSEVTTTAQSLFYAAVRPGCESVGVELTTPSAIYDHIAPGLLGARASRKKPLEATGGLPPQISGPTTKVGTAALTQISGPTKVGMATKASTAASTENGGSLKPKSGSSTLKQPPRGGVPEQRNDPSPSPLVTWDKKSRVLDDSPDYERIAFSDSGGNPDLEYLRTVMTAQEKRITALEAASKEHAQVRREVAEVRASLKEMDRNLKLLGGRGQQFGGQGQGGSSAGLSEESCDSDKNKRFLKSMNNLQVQSLLTAMDLSQYKESFAREHVTGELLFELEEDDLHSDLGVTSRIHRIRLLKVIKGSHSAQSILSGLDPYVR